jgi:hypothetical protein
MSYCQSLSSPIHAYSDVFSLDDLPSSNIPEAEFSQQLDSQWDGLEKIQGLNVLKWTPLKAELFDD